MIISAKVIRRPRRRHYCANCHQALDGPHLRLYGAAYSTDPPYVLRACGACSRRSPDPKVVRAVAELEACRC